VYIFQTTTLRRPHDIFHNRNSIDGFGRTFSGASGTIVTPQTARRGFGNANGFMPMTMQGGLRNFNRPCRTPTGRCPFQRCDAHEQSRDVDGERRTLVVEWLSALTRRRSPAIIAAMTRDQLAKRIADVSLLRGEFTLRSGREEQYYLDKYRFETQPDVLIELGKMFASACDDEVDRIAGAELGAVSLAAATSMACGKPFGDSSAIRRRITARASSSRASWKRRTRADRRNCLTTGGQVIEARRH
jgi:orotate phosphoribosyltransferase